MFCSDRQLMLHRPTRLCDLIALVHVAYYFVYKDLPSTEYAAVMSKMLGKNLFRQN